MKILIALLILSAVILFHEFGHFLLAKLNHIVVTEFSLGMGPRILSFKKGGTRYSWKLLPIGGSCAMLGEDEETRVPGSFNGAGVWRRISVVAAGPVFNFILAFIIATIIIGIAGVDRAEITEVKAGSAAYEAGLREGDLVVKYQGNGIANASELNFDMEIDGIPTDGITMTVKRDGKKQQISYIPDSEDRYLLGFQYTKNADGAAEIVRVTNHSPLFEAGAQGGDVITAVNGTELKSYEALYSYFEEHPMDGSEINMTISRNGHIHELTAAPEVTTLADAGFSVWGMRTRVSIPQSIAAGVQQTGYWIHVTLKSIGGLIRGVFSVKEMSGPVGIVNTIGTTYQEARSYGVLEAVLSLLNIAVLLSANLGVMNLLPLPALDGGRLVFMIIEAIRRKPINQNIEGVVHFIGFAALMALMVFVCFNDVIKLF